MNLDLGRGSLALGLHRGALRETRNRSCACGRGTCPSPLSARATFPRHSFCRSWAQSCLPSSSACLLWPRFAYLPETRRRYSSHVLDPRRHDDLQFQTNPPHSRPSPPGFSVSSSASFLARDRCWARNFPEREFQDFQIAPRLFALSLFGA